MRNLARLVCATLIMAFMSAPGVAAACTLWAGAGESVAGGGTLIAKNRDWAPDHQQQIRLITPKRGYRLIALYAVGNRHEGTKAGINEKGLVAVSASPPRHLAARENYQGKTSMRTMLTRYDSVAAALEALDRGEWVCGPEYLMLADGKEVACIEFAAGGAYEVVARTAAGVAFHTNHYLAPRLADLNKGKLASSMKRCARIEELLADKAVHDTDDFRRYSADSVLWRTGDAPAAARTLASWIIRQPRDGSAILYLKMANPGMPVAEYEFAVDDLFAGRVDLARIE
ncbi:C45 family autoproteolytic acyltransferase/hydolase [Anaeroselena agilis]|uniref:C45 family autoproteolytic acyltransferase/hydrolase n=1 Tax=Anaeroselena agilis TaxID=3063788 RepID=A0ABU3P4N2_9FIRM|nr:C45 family autoproteolytic acyltransferase/hydrolase [Selenomonadales bacterium 4137-cl]